MFPIPSRRTSGPGPRLQRGVATLLVALMILIILTIIVLTSSNVALFEQKTTVNENRQRLAEQAAEYAMNLGGEYLKANVVNIAQNEDASGWLTAGSSLRWQPCPETPSDANHPCMAEPDPNVRKALYYYTTDGSAVTDASDAKLDLPYSSMLPSGVAQTSVGDSATGSAFPVTVRLHALLCRLDTTVGATPTCQLSPTTGNRIAVTLVAEATMTDESAASTMKETWATYNAYNSQAAVPLVASGLVEGLGNATIVAAPNAGGYGLPGSIWSPRDVDVDDSGSGVGSVATCHLGDYLQDTPVGELETTCATDANACGCDVSSDSSDFLSGHIGSVKKEGVDILDIDGDNGALPDIQFFPGAKEDGTCMDDATVNNDDNLFEWIFSQDVNAASTCATAANVATEDQVLSDLDDSVHITNCNGLSSSSSGVYYMESTDTGGCDLPDQVGSPDNPVVLVVNDEARVSAQTIIYGMLYVRDTTGAGTEASVTGNGNAKVFGSVVVEGDVDINGGIDIVYVDTSAGTPGKKLSQTTRFARVPGSWLDSRTGF